MPGTEVERFSCVVCRAQVSDEEPAGYLHDNTSEQFCQACHDDGPIVTCCDCDNCLNYEDDPTFGYGDSTLCESCYDSSYFRCEGCEETEHNEEGNTIEVGDFATYCNSCFEELPSCADCGEVTLDPYEVDEEDTCRDCGRTRCEEGIAEIRDMEQDDDDSMEEAEERLMDYLGLAVPLNAFGAGERAWTCTRCDNQRQGTLPHGGAWDQSYWLVNRLIVGTCRQCVTGEPSMVYPNMQEDGGVRPYKVLSYSHKPTPEFKKTERDIERRALHFGTEVEMEMYDRHEERTAALRQLATDDEKHKLFYCKSDACIGNGFEVVSHPFTYDWMTQHRDAFDAQFRLVEFMKGFEATNCGMHIHMSADAFTNLHLFKFMRWFYSNKEFIRAIARRPKGKLDGWADLKSPEDKRLLKYTLNKENRLGLGRAALNVGGRQTIECRIFRSTLSPTAYYGNIEFLQSLFDYTKNCGVKQMEFDPYIDFVKQRGHAYKNFINLTDTIRMPIEAEGE